MIEQINVISSLWFDWMFSMFWQISLLILLIGGIDQLIKNWVWPQVRYALWILILLKLVIPPSWTFSGSVVPNLRIVADTQINAINIQSENLKSEDSQFYNPPVDENIKISDQQEPLISTDRNEESTSITYSS